MISLLPNSMPSKREAAYGTTVSGSRPKRGDKPWQRGRQTTLVRGSSALPASPLWRPPEAAKLTMARPFNACMRLLPSPPVQIVYLPRLHRFQLLFHGGHIVFNEHQLPVIVLKKKLNHRMPDRIQELPTNVHASSIYEHVQRARAIKQDGRRKCLLISSLVRALRLFHEAMSRPC